VSCCRAIVRFARKVFDRIEDLAFRASDDPLVQRALEADLGLPPGALDRAKVGKRPELTGIDEYINDVDANAEKLTLTVDAIKAYVKFWTSLFELADEEDPQFGEEILYRLFQLTTVELMKFDHPTAYAVMRFLGGIKQDILPTAEEVFVPQLPSNLFSADYWENFPDEFARSYTRFRLDQADVLEPGNGGPPPTPEERIRRDQLGFDVFGISDAVLLTLFILLMWKGRALERSLGVVVDQTYGWELPPRAVAPPCGELPPGEQVPLADHIASRAHTLRISGPKGPAHDDSFALTQLFLVDGDDNLGWLLSLSGRLVVERQVGSAERPIRVAMGVEADPGLAATVKFSGNDRFVFGGAPGAAMELTVEPVQSATRGPAISIPESTGTRLEIGDFSVNGKIANDGFGIRAEAKRSALVIVSDEADSFVDETLPAKETRIEFDLGLVFDHENGFYVDGGSRLATTIPINETILGIDVQAIQLALAPVSTPAGSELRLVATTSFSFKLGPVQVAVEQIGITFDIGSSSDPVTDDVLILLGPLLYFGDLGFRPPSGAGILVDCGPVTGGGFLFFDRDNEQYAGVVQLEICEWLSLKAVGLITTRLPDGSKGFSMLVIVSVEFDPGINLWPPGLTLNGAGGLIGIHRTLDADALRAGLRNHALDAVLFPKDPVVNAGQLLTSLRTLFPPARGRHLFGLSVILGFGRPAILTAELMVILERGNGENTKLAILGQLHLELPRHPKQVLVMHVDGAGIWDFERGTFSLDARLYDSRLAFITFHGDFACRHSSRGDDAGYLVSAGGYHPEFAAPASFPKLERLKIVFHDSEKLRLIVTGYVAFTSNTKQFGGHVDFFGAFGGFSVECRIGADVLLDDDAGYIFDFELEAKIKYKGMTLLGVDVEGRMTGPSPKRVKGKWSIDLWLFSVSKSFECVSGPDRPPTELPPANPLPELVAALRDARSWTASLPVQARTLVTLRDRPGGGDVLLHPLGDLSVRQQILPLGIDIDRFAGGVPTGERRFAITQVKLGGRDVPATEVRPLTELFAAAQYLELSDEDKLARPSFEPYAAGVSLQLQGLTFGGDSPATASQAAVSEIDFDDRIVGADGGVSGGGRGVLGGLAAAMAAEFGPAGRSPLRELGMSKFRAPGPQLTLRPDGFVVAGVDDLAQVDSAAPAGASFTAVAQALERHLQANPQARGRLQVVPAFAAEGAE
jgi:hypothetical protein